MKTLIKKEIRLLLPAWSGAMLLAVVPAWLIEYFIPNQSAVVEFPPPLFILPGLLLLGVSSFGQEFSAKTFSLLLSQPVIRNRAWRLKILMLALAFVLVLAAETISWSLFIQLHPKYSSHYLDAFGGLWLWAVALFTGGLWTTLLLRQEIGAFWISLLMPASILAVVGILGDLLKFSERIEDLVGDLAVLIYSATGFLVARRMFLHAQDIQWTGGNFFFWRRKRTEQARSFRIGPIRNRFVALFWKEVQLHEANLFISVIVFALNLGVLVLLPHISNSNLAGALQFAWALWLLMPVLIGCAAVADERRLGVAESQLCQPVSRQATFSIKFLSGLALSVIFGAVMPTLIERSRDFGITNWTAFWIFVAAPVIFFISFYASTLSRSTVQAIGVAIAVSVAGCFGFLTFVVVVFHIGAGTFWVVSDEYYDANLQFGRFYLLVWLCLLLFPLVLARLMFWNYKWVHQGWRLFRFNVAAILVSFTVIFILTNGIFYRTWELFSPIETARGPARLTVETPVKLSERYDGIIALLPDGRLWQQRIETRWFGFGSVDIYRWDRIPKTDRFIDSNWADASQTYFYTLGIQRNGSLWCIPNSGNNAKMLQVGSDTNWQKVAANENGFLLLKKGGTLWLWGTNQANNANDEFAGIAKKIKLDLAMPPGRIDAGSNWTDVTPFSPFCALAQRDDGTYWSWRELSLTDGSSSFHLIQETDLDSQWISYADNGNFSAEVKTNGQLWLFSQIDTNWNSKVPNGGVWDWVMPRYTRKTRLGTDSDWKAVTIGNGSLILLRKDGTLWRWKGPWQGTFRPVQLGRQSDWIGLETFMGIAVAADGGLWSWNDLSDHIWLAPSRKPVYLGNIFEEAGDANQPAAHIKTHENAD